MSCSFKVLKLFSKIAIGTVQFGMSYGVSNKDGQTDIEEVASILAYAQEHGIFTLDTAAVYGNSEATLGQVLNSSSREVFQIITKTPQFRANEINDTELSLLRDTFTQSLAHLGAEQIDGLLIHACDDLFANNGQKLFHELEMLKAQGKVNKIGVSVYNSQQIDRVLNEFSIDLVQLPVNVFDQRLIEDGSLDRLKKENVEVHARSAFLQGLLLMPVESISPWFTPIMRKIKRFHALAEEMRLSPLQLALGFVNALAQVDRVVIGVNNLAQLQEVVDAANTSIEIMQCQELSVQDPRFTNPGNWQS
jgi:aryl-alcohol dehydrogenase-like predicted oxidoreductase